MQMIRTQTVHCSKRRSHQNITRHESVQNKGDDMMMPLFIIQKSKIHKSFKLLDLDVHTCKPLDSNHYFWIGNDIFDVGRKHF